MLKLRSSPFAVNLIKKLSPQTAITSKKLVDLARQSFAKQNLGG